MQNSRSPRAEVQELLRAGRHEEAERRLQEICAGPGADAESWFFLGAFSGKRGDAVGAENCFRQALAIKPDFLQARFNLGIALRDQNRLDEARAELEAVLAAQPGHVEAGNALGYVYVRLERWDEAERCFRAALARNPLFPDALVNLGNLLSSSARWAEAVALYRSNLASALARLGRIEEAVAAYRLAITANPTNAEMHAQLGIVLYRLERKREAEQAFREALRLRPDHAEAQYFLATLGVIASPPAAPVSYVTRFFDDYADTFDVELVEKSQYRTPEMLFGAAQPALTGRKNLDVLDLGCGTGLCGPLFRPLARTLAGVDLSPGMVAKARARKVYDELDVGDLTTALLKRKSALDLVLAADVFIHIGDLSPVFEAAAQALRPGGLFVFSIETTQVEEGKSYVLRGSGRFAHAQTYVTQLADRFGLEPVSCEEFCIRFDGGQPVAGALHVLRRTA
jgi:predicted TPR repeat methyltransferase